MLFVDVPIGTFVRVCRKEGGGEGSLFCCAVLNVISSFAIISLGNSELGALLNLN